MSNSGIGTQGIRAALLCGAGLAAMASVPVFAQPADQQVESVTVTGLIGLGGYGGLINDGLKRTFSTPIVVGAALSVAMAIVLDLGLVALERSLTPWARRRVAR